MLNKKIISLNKNNSFAVPNKTKNTKPDRNRRLKKIARNKKNNFKIKRNKRISEQESRNQRLYLFLSLLMLSSHLNGFIEILFKIFNLNGVNYRSSDSTEINKKERIDPPKNSSIFKTNENNSTVSNSTAYPIIAETCNGDASYCKLHLNEMTFVTTHNSFSVPGGTFPPNQILSISRQLQEGVRALMLDLYDDGKGNLFFCHGTCWLGGIPAKSVLLEIKEFLNNNPNEVIVLLMERYVTPIQFRDALMQAGIYYYTYFHERNRPFPTLRQLIINSGRLVVFSDKMDSHIPSMRWLLPVWAYAWETPFNVYFPWNFDCTENRGTQNNRTMGILNHFLRLPGTSVLVNSYKSIMDHAQRCFNLIKKWPTFIAVDYYLGKGAAVNEVVNDINRQNCIS